MTNMNILYPPIIDTAYSAVSTSIPVEFINTTGVDTSRVGVRLQIWLSHQNKWGYPWIGIEPIEDGQVNIDKIYFFNDNDVGNIYDGWVDSDQGAPGDNYHTSHGKIRLQLISLSTEAPQNIENFASWIEDSSNKDKHSIWSDTIEKYIIEDAKLDVNIDMTRITLATNISNELSYVKASVYSHFENRYLIQPNSIFYSENIELAGALFVPGETHKIDYDVEYTTKEGFVLTASDTFEISAGGDVLNTELNIVQSNAGLNISPNASMVNSNKIDIVRKSLDTNRFEKIGTTSFAENGCTDKTPLIGEVYEYYIGYKEIDDAINSVKNVPINTSPCVEVSKVGGMTYIDGETLKSAKVTKIESIGNNVLPFPYSSGSSKTDNGVTWTVNEDGSIRVKGTAEGDNSAFYLYSNKYVAPPGIKKGETYVVSPYVNNVLMSFNVFIGDVQTLMTNGSVAEPGAIYQENYTGAIIYLLVLKGNTVDTTFYPMINKGTVALPYRSYTKRTLSIPSMVQALNGYGEGVNSACYNYIDWENRMFVKRVGCVDMGTLDWVGFASTVLHTNRLYKPNAGSLVVIPPQFNQIYVDTYGAIVATFDEGTFTSIDEAKAAITGIMLYYELAEPIITDISDILPDDNSITIESNGTITMVNEYGYDVPNEITFIRYYKDSNPVLVNSGDIFLMTKDKTLKIKYDPNISSYKYNIQEKVTPTLGAKYPKITRNSEQNYRSFTISGTIARGLDWENDNEDFRDSLGSNYDNVDAKTREFILEKRFRDNVLEFLHSPEIKLYKSLTEGNMFVYLTNISLTPKKELGRMIYTFSAQATEVAEPNSANYQKYFPLD